MSVTTRNSPWAAPGVGLLAKWIEQGEPGGVNWIARSVPLLKSASSRQPSLA
jgi:hypothetical protein